MTTLTILSIVLVCNLTGALALIAACWFTRNIFPTLFMPDDW